MKGYGEEILRMEDIVKTFDLGGGKKLTASDHVTISLHKGETLGIVGESGSGKSTLAKILTRLYTMDSGRILLHGKDMTALKARNSGRPGRISKWFSRTPLPPSTLNSGSGILSASP